MLALLLGALGPFTPAQAEVTTIWSATLSPATIGSSVGCDNSSQTQGNRCSSALSDDDFTYNGTQFHVRRISFSHNAEDRVIDMVIDFDMPVTQALRDSGIFYTDVGGNGEDIMSFSMASSPSQSRYKQSQSPSSVAVMAGTSVKVQIVAATRSESKLPRRLTPDPDLLTGLTINDGVRNLRIESNVANTVGLGGTSPIYTVQVSPGVRSVTVTPTWTNTNITSVSGAVRHVTYGKDGSSVTWSSSESGAGKTVDLMSSSLMVANGTTRLTLSVAGVTSAPYQFLIQHNLAWQSANERLRQLELQIPQ